VYHITLGITLLNQHKYFHLLILVGYVHEVAADDVGEVADDHVDVEGRHQQVHGAPAASLAAPSAEVSGVAGRALGFPSIRTRLTFAMIISTVLIQRFSTLITLYLHFRLNYALRII
jgi:hypothetical protein